MGTETEGTDTLGENRSEWPEVAIIVLNWNNYEDTAECLSSLESVEYPNYHVVVIDNGSTDGSGEKLQDEFRWCQHIRNDENRGYSAGVNVGINDVLSQDSEYIVLLNNDAIVNPNFLCPLVKTAERKKDVGIVTGIIHTNTGDRIQSAGRDFNKYLVKGNHLNKIKSEVEYEVDCISGALALFPSQVLSELEGLNESYFLGPDDVDVSIRAKKRGYKIFVNPDSSIRHKVGSTGGTENAFRYYHSTKGRLNLASDHLDINHRVIFYPFFISSRIFRFIQWTIQAKPILIWGVLLGIHDYLSGEVSRNRPSLLPS